MESGNRPPIAEIPAIGGFPIGSRHGATGSAPSIPIPRCITAACTVIELMMDATSAHIAANGTVVVCKCAARSSGLAERP